MVVCRRSGDPERSRKCEKCWLDIKGCVQSNEAESESYDEEQSEEENEEEHRRTEENDESSEEEVSDAIVIHPTADVPGVPNMNLFHGGTAETANRVDSESVWFTALAKGTHVGEYLKASCL